MKKLLICLMTTFFLSIGFSQHTYAYTYKIKSGDTLSKISKKHKVTVSQLKHWNKLKSDRIQINQILHIKPSLKGSTNKINSTKKPIKVLKMTATAYTVFCKNCSGKTATGLDLRNHPRLKVISVDPKVIPLGSKVYVEGYGYAIAADTGSAIKRNKIDVFIPNEKAVRNWGVKNVTVKVY